MTDLLNPSQYHALLFALRQLEEHLREADGWLDKHEEVGILYRQRLRLSAERRIAARNTIAEALGHIADTARRLGLQAMEEDAASALRSRIVVSWSDLCDMQSGKLRRYGQVAAGLARELDPSVEVLTQLALSLARILAEHDL